MILAQLETKLLLTTSSTYFFRKSAKSQRSSLLLVLVWFSNPIPNLSQYIQRAKKVRVVRNSRRNPHKRIDVLRTKRSSAAVDHPTRFRKTALTGRRGCRNSQERHGNLLKSRKL
jgi:hypothetical protein